MSTARLVAVLSLAGAALWATGCADTYYDVGKVRQFLLEPRAPVSGTEYRVYPPDSIRITSRQVSEINGVTLRVRPDGKINLPLVGEVDVAGKTPAEIEDALRKASGEYYAKVDATVNIAAYNSQSFYVFGQVGSPGPKAWTGRDTLLDVLARAQPTRLAWPERIHVIRAPQPQVGGYVTSMPSDEYRTWGVHPPGTVAEPPKEMVINLMAMVKHGDLSNNVLLMPNDVVYVQANPFAKIGLALQTILYPVSPIMQAVRLPGQISDAGDDLQDFPNNGSRNNNNDNNDNGNVRRAVIDRFLRR